MIEVYLRELVDREPFYTEHLKDHLSIHFRILGRANLLALPRVGERLRFNNETYNIIDILHNPEGEQKITIYVKEII